jgi:hypothetical protein
MQHLKRYDQECIMHYRSHWAIIVSNSINMYLCNITYTIILRTNSINMYICDITYTIILRTNQINVYVIT